MAISLASCIGLAQLNVTGVVQHRLSPERAADPPLPGDGICRQHYAPDPYRSMPIAFAEYNRSNTETAQVQSQLANACIRLSNPKPPRVRRGPRSQSSIAIAAFGSGAPRPALVFEFARRRSRFKRSFGYDDASVDVTTASCGPSVIYTGQFVLTHE